MNATHILLILILVATLRATSRPAVAGENWETFKAYGIIALVASPFIAAFLLFFA
jgi:hypothetical protein